MSCPTCRGQERRPIAPGYFECTTRVEAFATGPGGGPYGPVVSFVEPCGVRYQEGPGAGSAAAVCRCRTYAVRSCTDCDAALCGDCSVRVSGDWTCTRCRDARHNAEIARERRHRDELLAPYLALPSVDNAAMTAYLGGRTDGIQDGVTHQLWDWTNGDVLRVVEEIWPGNSFSSCCYRYGGSMTDGYRTYGDTAERLQVHGRVLEHSYADVDKNRHGPVTDTIETSGLDARFNSPWLLEPEDGRIAAFDRLARLRDAIAEVMAEHHESIDQRRLEMKYFFMIMAVLGFGVVVGYLLLIAV